MLKVGEEHYCAILASNIVICDGDDQYGRTTPPTSKLYQLFCWKQSQLCFLNGERSIGMLGR